MPRALAALFLLALAPAASPQAWEAVPDPRSKALAALVEPLEAAPNDPGLHLEAAAGYFQRGAPGDADRTYRHVARAVSLDRAREAGADRLLTTLTPGRTERPLGDLEAEVDRKLDASLGAPGADPAARPQELVRVGLAERMVRRAAPTDPASFPEVRGQLDQAFGWDQAHRASWEGRIAALDSPPAPEGWQGTMLQAIQRTVSRDGAPAPTVATAGAEIPDPFARRNDAVLAYFQGRPQEAVEGFLDAAAGVEVLRASELARAAEAEVGPAAPPAAPGPAELPEPPAPPPVRAPAPSVVAPAGVSETLGERSLAAVEAMSNPEIPQQEVQREVAAASRVGAVGEPLLLDLDGDGVPAVTGGLLPDGRLERAGAVRFDFEGRGTRSLTEWVRPGRDGLLAVDLDGDGVISSGLELFGDTHGAPDGFARLAVFDLDRDGWVRGAEAATLAVWVDDGDAVCQPGELRPLFAHRIVALSTRPVDGAAEVVTAAGSFKAWDWLPDLVSEGTRAAR